MCCVSSNPKAVNPFLTIQTKTYVCAFCRQTFRIIFLRLRHKKDVYFCNVGILWKKCGIYFYDSNVLTNFFSTKPKKEDVYANNLYVFLVEKSTL